MSSSSVDPKNRFWEESDQRLEDLHSRRLLPSHMSRLTRIWVIFYEDDMLFLFIISSLDILSNKSWNRLWVSTHNGSNPCNPTRSISAGPHTPARHRRWIITTITTATTSMPQKQCHNTKLQQQATGWSVKNVLEAKNVLQRVSLVFYSIFVPRTPLAVLISWIYNTNLCPVWICQLLSIFLHERLPKPLQFFCYFLTTHVCFRNKWKLSRFWTFSDWNMTINFHNIKKKILL
jgi:hypothetical protein